VVEPKSLFDLKQKTGNLYESISINSILSNSGNDTWLKSLAVAMKITWDKSILTFIK
jgi:hypothetical protein